jgi:hypothetical protein
VIGIAHGTSVAVIPAVRITASGCHAQVVTGVLGLLLAGIARQFEGGSTWLFAELEALSTPNLTSGFHRSGERHARVSDARTCLLS